MPTSVKEVGCGSIISGGDHDLPGRSLAQPKRIAEVSRTFVAEHRGLAAECVALRPANANGHRRARDRGSDPVRLELVNSVLSSAPAVNVGTEGLTYTAPLRGSVTRP